MALVLLGSSHQSEPDLELGKRIYFKRCKVCHGEYGTTNPFAASALNPPPRDFTTKQSKKELTPERMIRSVTYGRPGTAMMPWKDNLSANEIQAVVFYVRRTFMVLSETGADSKH